MEKELHESMLVTPLKSCHKIFRDLGNETYEIIKDIDTNRVGKRVNEQHVDKCVQSDQKVCVIKNRVSDIEYIISKYTYYYNFEPDSLRCFGSVKTGFIMD